MRPSLQHRRNPPLRSRAHRALRPSPIRRNLHAVIIRTGSIRTPWVEDLPANGLNEPLFLDPPRMAKILVFAAGPYTSGARHLGPAVSPFIPPDVFARDHRLKAYQV